MNDWRAPYMSHDTKKVTQTATVTSANGVSGCLIYVHGLDMFMFRVYDDEHNFTDYNINHCDLSVTINDNDAEFYNYPDGRAFLDHSRQTLGVEE